MRNEDEELELRQIFLRLNESYRQYALSMLRGLRFAQEQALLESKQQKKMAAAGNEDAGKQRFEEDSK